MFVEIHLPLGQGGPLVLESHQVVIRNGEGTPICVAMTRGPDRCTHVAHTNDGSEFEQLLRILGLPPVSQIKLQLPPAPPGPRLFYPGQS